MSVSRYFEEANEEALREDVDLIEERRDKPSINSVAKKQHVASYYNKRVKLRNFQVGDLVLISSSANRPPSELKKLSPAYEDLYIVTKVVEK